MRHDVDTRLAAITAELERRRLIQEEPIDPLSASLFAFEAEMAALDEVGVAALAGLTDEDGNAILTLAQARQMAADYRQEESARKVASLYRK